MEMIGGWFSSVGKQLNAAVGYSGVDDSQKPEEKVSGLEKSADSKIEVPEIAKSSDELKEPECREAAPQHVQPSLEDVANKAYSGAKAFTDSFVTFGKRIVKESAGELKTVFETRTILTELDEENRKFAEEQDRQRLLSQAIPSPAWCGCPEETNVKKQMLSLSLDSRNFLRDPPAGCDFHFDGEANHGTALAMLAEDPNLRKMRFELVPKQIKEDRFWRNYFYRVSLIKQSVALRNFSQQESEQQASVSQQGSPKKHDLPPVETSAEAVTGSVGGAEFGEPTLSPVGVEFASDCGDLSDQQDADLETARRMLGIFENQIPNDVANSDKQVKTEKDWENELLADLTDYELVSEQTGKSEHEWEEELSDLLQKELIEDVQK